MKTNYCMQIRRVMIALLIMFGSIYAQKIGIGASTGHGIACDVNGVVFTWGSNYHGELGNNTLQREYFPIDISEMGALAGKTIVDVTSGANFSLAIDNTGKVYSWGLNENGQLGNSSTTRSLIPITVSSSGALNGVEITSISAGWGHVIALDNNGKVYGWGANAYGMIGNNSTEKCLTPVDVSGSGALAGKKIVQISATGLHSMALDENGKVYTWGFNHYGQLGNGNNTDSKIPVDISGLGALNGKTIVRIGTGENHSLAVDSEGKIYAWGSNSSGQLGDNRESGQSCNLPKEITAYGALSGKVLVDVAGGDRHSLALDNEGKVYSWGVNYYGTLGNNTTTLSDIPVAISTFGAIAGKNIIQIFSGSSFSSGLGNDGKIYVWGENSNGQLGIGMGSNQLVPVELTTTVLPVELSSFSCSMVEGKVALSWETVTERNNHGFEIERASVEKGKAFEKIGFVEGNGNSNSVKVYSFIDNKPEEGNVIYRLKQIDFDGKYEYSKEIEVSYEAVKEFSLDQNYPNPFNPTTNISFKLAESGKVRIKIFNAIGQEVAELVNRTMEAGIHNVTFNASNLPSGTYFCKMTAGSFTKTSKMLLIK